MNIYKVLILRNNVPMQTITGAINYCAQKVASAFNNQVAFNFEIHDVNDTLSYMPFGDGSAKGVRFDITDSHSADAIGYNTLVYCFETQEQGLNNWTYIQEYRPVCQVVDNNFTPDQVGEEMWHELTNSFFSGLQLRGISLVNNDKEETDKIVPYIKDVCSTLPIDSVLQGFIQWIKDAIALLSKRKKTLKDLMNAMARQEGFYDVTSTPNIPQRNHNPLDLKYVGQSLATGKDNLGFCIFPDDEKGFLAAQKDLRLKQQNNPSWTIKDLIYVWSATDQASYVSNVCKWLGITQDYKFSDFL